MKRTTRPKTLRTWAALRADGQLAHFAFGIPSLFKSKATGERFTRRRLRVIPVTIRYAVPKRPKP